METNKLSILMTKYKIMYFSWYAGDFLEWWVFVTMVFNPSYLCCTCFTLQYIYNSVWAMNEYYRPIFVFMLVSNKI